jgi:hypothetical protein
MNLDDSSVDGVLCRFGYMVMGDPERIRALVTGAGFAEPEIEQVETAWPYADADQHWSLTRKLSGSLADAIEELGEDEREAARADVRSRIEPLIADGPVRGRVHVVTTT